MCSYPHVSHFHSLIGIREAISHSFCPVIPAPPILVIDSDTTSYLAPPY